MEINIRNDVKNYYGGIAKGLQEYPQARKGCGASCNKSNCAGTSLYSQKYTSGITGDVLNASLGCGNPFSFSNIQKGEIVIDLGSGGGIDVLIASKLVGETGKVYGVDMTEEMLDLANINLEKNGAKNVEFVRGYIENIPLPDETADIVISNCVINLSENKEEVFRETYRVLKKGGRIAIADVVRMKEIPDELKNDKRMWVGCVSGSLHITEYENILRKVGFSDIEITPIVIYGKDMIKKAPDSSKTDEEIQSILDAIDGAFASAHIQARK
jgi:ubiquinone/menaquinone biosynthesis C-methylase UbiE